jgi:hypothetical protein
MVAEQLYSFTLTVFVGLGTDRPIGLGWKLAVSKIIGRAEMDHPNEFASARSRWCVGSY